MEKPEWNKITFEYMKKYIEENAPQDKSWFKSVSITTKEVKEKGKYVEKQVYDHFTAREAFCERYMPEIIPVAKPKQPTKAELLANW